MSLWEPIISGGLSFIAGFIISRITANSDYDRERCNAVINAIDNVVSAFHERLMLEGAAANASGMMFDYQVRGLVDDTTLLPIIGRRCFDEEYTETLGKIYKLSLDSPLDMPQSQKVELIKCMTTSAIDLKKIINSNHQTLRFFRRN